MLRQKSVNSPRRDPVRPLIRVLVRWVDPKRRTIQPAEGGKEIQCGNIEPIRVRPNLGVDTCEGISVEVVHEREDHERESEVVPIGESFGPPEGTLNLEPAARLRRELQLNAPIRESDSPLALDASAETFEKKR